MMDDKIFEMIYELKISRGLDWNNCCTIINAQFHTKLTKDTVKQEINQYFKRMTGSAPFTEMCPICGNSLKIRQGPYGFFIGCSMYPECVFKAVRGYGSTEWD